MKPIGGYFELEVSKGDHQYHKTPHALKSGRSSLQYILNHLKPDVVYIPYYTCDALLEPFEATHISYRFYEINAQLEPATLIDLQPGEYFLYVNYLDLKRDTVARLTERYKEQLIVDCTQAFFAKGNGVAWFFNSCRKYFGVPDGSYLYPPEGVRMRPIEMQNEEYLFDHLLKRFNGHPGEGYETFLKNEVLAGNDVSNISKLSEYLLSQIDYDNVAATRRNNYQLLHDHFKSVNLFNAALPADSVPMSYPLLLDKIFDKQPLFAESIFIPTFWKDTLYRIDNGFTTEKSLTEYLLPLPVDHRYNEEDMRRMMHILSETIHQH